MKKALLLLASAALLLAGCAKEQFSGKNEGGLQEVSFTASLENGVATKAVADGDGNAASVNRCIMEIYYGNDLYARQYAKVTDKQATFTAQVVSNRTFTVAFWADKVDDASTEAGLAADKYYTTTSLKGIALKGTYVGNDDARDAFFVCTSCNVQQGGTAFTATLKRPFAQMNVITTDWDKVTVVEDLKPEKVDVTIKNPMVKFNAVTGEASADAGTASLHYAADLYTSPAPVSPVSASEKTLSMDYLFASASKEVIDMEWKALHGSDANVEHTFASVPYQRNYRTNIKGALLTTTGQWTVTVDPIWDSPDYTVPYYVASSIQDAQNYISSQNDEQKKAVDLSSATISQSDVTNDGTIHFILKTTSPVDLVNFTLPAIPSTITDCQGWTIEYETNYPTQNVGVNAPAGTRVVINAPTSHVVVTGTTYTEIVSSTGDNSLVIPQGVSVETLEVSKGGLEIHGTVSSATVSGTTDNVFVRECENLSQEVYNVLKNYIAPNYKGSQNTDGSWNIALEDYWPNFAASEFSAIDPSAKTVAIASPAELALLAKKINSGTSYAGYTISISGNLDMSAHYWIPINAYNNNLSGATIKGINNAVISNLKIEKAVYSGNYNYYAGFIAQTVGTVTFKDLTFSGAVSVDNGSGVANVLGESYGNVTFDNVKVLNSTVVAETTAGALLGFTGGDGITVTVKDCSVENVTVKAAYSYAVFVGLVNINDQVVFEGENSAEDSHAVFDTEKTSEFNGFKTIKGYTFGVDGTDLWVTGVKDAWAECRTNPSPKMTIDNVKYTIKGDIFYHADGVVVDVCAPDPVVKVGDIEYADIAAAVEAIPAGTATTISLIDDIGSKSGDAITWKEYAEQHVVKIKSGQDVTLDLNGHKIYAKTTVNGYTSFLLVQNGGSLTIKSSTAGGELNYLDGKDNEGGFAISSEGSLTIQSGKIENFTECKASAIQGAVDVHANEWGTPYGHHVTFSMSGGVLKSVNDNTLRIYDSSQTGTGYVVIDFNISGGEIYGADAVFIMPAWIPGPDHVSNDIHMNNINVSVTGGKFDTNNGIRVYQTTGENTKDYKAIKISVTDGEFEIHNNTRYRVNHVAFQSGESTESATVGIRSFTDVTWSANAPTYTEN